MYRLVHIYKRWQKTVKRIIVPPGMKTGKTACAPGRPRAFDADAALERALQVFWRKGYEATSLSDLTEAMGINRPSLYAAYGNKEALFRKALDRYAAMAAATTGDAMNEPTARGAVARLLRKAAQGAACPTGPRGCLMVSAALAGGEEAETIRQELAARRAGTEAIIRARMERAREEGDLPPGTDPADLARYVVTVLHGLSVQAAGGATREQMRGVVETALRVWPGGAEVIGDQG